MNSTSREIRRLNIKSFFNRCGLWRCYRCCLNSVLFAIWAVSVYLHFRLPSLSLEVCVSFVICLNISLPFIQLLLFEQDTSVFYLNSPALKFRNVLQHTEGRSSFSCYQNIKEDIFTELEVLLFYFLHKLILHENIHATRE